MTSIHHGKHFEDYLRILRKRKWAFLVAFTGIVASVAIYVLMAIPIYMATVQILIERPTPKLLETRDTPLPYDYFNEEFYQTQYKLLESRALARKVADKLQLKNNPYFQSIFQALPPNADDTMKQRAEEDLVSAILGGLKVLPIRRSSLVYVNYSHFDPKFAALMVNTLAQAYIEQSLELRFAASQEAATWLNQKLTESRTKLEKSEAKMNRYKRANNIIALEDKENITAQKLEQLNKELVTAQTHRMEAETRFKEVSQGKAISQVLNNPLIQTLKAQEAKVIAEQSDLGKKYGEEHPRMIQLNHELGAVRSKISTEMGMVVQGIKNEYFMALEQEKNLKAALEAQKEATQDLGDRGIEYRVLLRDVESNRALYENMLKTLKTTTATENVPTTNIRIVYPAMVPNVPVSPKKVRSLFLAMISGLFVGVSLAFGLDALDTTLKTPEEIEGYLELPNLAMIPHLEVSSSDSETKSEALTVHHDTHSMGSEAYRILRTGILLSSPGKAPRSLLVTSSRAMEGKSLTVSNLGSVMAKAEAKVLLVDSDLRRPTLHTLFNVPMEPGLSNFLIGDLDDLPMVETIVPNLFLVPSGPIPPNPSELLGSDRMRDFLSLAQAQFSRVILDSPPLSGVTDSAILATLVDGVMLVVKAESVPRRVVLGSKDQLLEVKARLLGTVLNDMSIKSNGYYYNRYYHYNYYHTPLKENTGDLRTQRGKRSTKSTSHSGMFAWIKSRIGNRKGENLPKG